MPTLDASFIAALIRHESAALATLAELEESGAPLATTPIDLLALFRGVYATESIEQNLREAKAILEHLTLLPIAEETCEVFGKIAAYLRAQGRPIGDLEGAIAAAALCSDERFSRVPGLTVMPY
ncbi:MAG: type II toxin-antitoxin system VapC family toxin [Methanomicrobiales archaeon]|nr:type II toxin-antitoxin system VapC family toxin [Methanomicrobiales archaeon]MDI6876930.1 type II toxin-antitoxin system VapC family toxin [Methanomicrobiales archaeon]